MTAPIARNAGVGRKLASGALWTMGGYGISQAIRLGTSMILTRILVPELFGIMLIVNTVRLGVELLSDIGISQNVVTSPNGEDSDFQNTAWTLQILRGAALFLLLAGSSVVAASVYDLPILVYLLPAAGLATFIAGFTSMSLPLLRRRMDYPRLAGFEVATSLLFSLFQIAIAYVYPTVWALIIGLIIGCLQSATLSFFVLRVKHRFVINRAFVREIISFGKWITAASAIFFLTSNLDRIYLPSVIALEALGIYAVARSITDAVSSLFVRLNNGILFPYVASRGMGSRDVVKEDLRATRMMFFSASAVLVGLLASSADWAVTLLFDSRYQSAGWMASFLLVGGWFSTLASSAEASLMGLGRPQATSFAQSAKLLWLVAALPLSIGAVGLAAGIAVIAASDAVRYVATIPSQRNASFSFLRQDAAATALLGLVVGGMVFVRYLAGVPLVLPWP